MGSGGYTVYDPYGTFIIVTVDLGGFFKNLFSSPAPQPQSQPRPVAAPQPRLAEIERQGIYVNGSNSAAVLAVKKRNQELRVPLAISVDRAAAELKVYYEVSGDPFANIDLELQNFITPANGVKIASARQKFSINKDKLVQRENELKALALATKEAIAKL